MPLLYFKHYKWFNSIAIKAIITHAIYILVRINKYANYACIIFVTNITNNIILNKA
jgi:hypothetical protein